MFTSLELIAGTLIIVGSLIGAYVIRKKTLEVIESMKEYAKEKNH